MNQDIKDKYLEIINRYKAKLEKFNKELEKTPYECVFNKQLLKDDIFEHELKGIVVMDNPGQEEKQQGAYLVGNAGKTFNGILESMGISRCNVIVLNKSSITTPSTTNLADVYENDVAKKIFLEEQQETFNTIKKLSLELRIPLMIHGYSNYLVNGRANVKHRKNAPLFVFFKELSDCKELHPFAHFYKHSSFGNLSKQIKAYKQELGIDNLTYQQYLDLGQRNLIGFFD